MYDWQRVARTLQTFAPGMVDLKYRAQHLTRNLRGRPFEQDFSVLEHFWPDPSDDFLDIGANRGQSVQAIRMYNRDNPITCFEPSERALRQLHRYTRGVQKISLRGVGLGAEPAEVTLYTPVYRGYVFDGLASVVRSEATDWLNSHRIMFFDRRKLEIIEEVVRIETLDQQNLRPAFAKIDVQGAELAVLKGGSDTIKGHRPVLLLEAPDDELEVEFLRTFGYEAYCFDGACLRRGLGRSVNAFLIPSERVREIDLPLAQ